jgi:hypothetical protein
MLRNVIYDLGIDRFFKVRSIEMDFIEIAYGGME